MAVIKIVLTNIILVKLNRIHCKVFVDSLEDTELVVLVVLHFNLIGPQTSEFHGDPINHRLRCTLALL